MGEFFIYILKSSVCLAVLYLFYRLFLSKETFYNFNRIAILGILVLSLALPLCEVTIKQQTEVQQTVLTLEQLLLIADKFAIEESTVPVQQITTAWWIRTILWIYLAGVAFFFFRNIYSLVQLIKLIRSSVKCKLQKGIWLVSHNNPNYAPFSWMNVIVLSHTDLEDNNTEILIHEMAHIRKRHSIDLLITDICIIFQWFNPAVWLFKQELQNIHEFQADEAVLDHGVNAKKYQLLLIKKAAGTRLYSMANSFNHSKLKKRITMMLKRKSNPWARLKYLYILPVAAIAVTAFARPEISKELKEISAVKVNDLAGIVEKKSEEINTELQDTLPITVGKVVAVDTTDNSLNVIRLDGYRNAGIITEDSIRFISSVTKDHNTEISISVGIDDTLTRRTNNSVIRLHGSSGLGEPLYVIDGKVEKSLTLSPESIHSISVLKDSRAIELYGEEAQNGIVVVHTKEYEKSLSTNQPVIVVDGKRLNAESFSSIEPSEIESMSVIKFDKMDSDKRFLVLQYGASNSAGLVLITTKNGKVQNTITVKGTVKDEDGKPIVGASVLVQGTYSGTITDLDGNFTLQAPVGVNIVVMYVDMVTAIAKATPELHFVLKPE